MEPLTVPQEYRVWLPTELLLLIIERTVPSDPRVLIPASHISTRTLLSLIKVSRMTYQLTSRLLRQRCMYIDSRRRLNDILMCMMHRGPTLPPIPLLRHMTSLYLAPFGPTLHEPRTAEGVRVLLLQVAETLRRLVVHIPFDSMDARYNHAKVRGMMRYGFERLSKLEEFVCLGDYPDMAVQNAQTDVWQRWPNLKRLVVFGASLDGDGLWRDIAMLPKLQHVVLARSGGLAMTNIKDKYFHQLPQEDVRLRRKIRLVLMEAAYEVDRVVTDGWREIDPANKMTVEVIEVPVPFFGNKTTDEVVTGWAKMAALDDSLWRLEGRRVCEGLHCRGCGHAA